MNGKNCDGVFRNVVVYLGCMGVMNCVVYLSKGMLGSGSRLLVLFMINVVIFGLLLFIIKMLGLVGLLKLICLLLVMLMLIF